MARAVEQKIWTGASVGRDLTQRLSTALVLFIILLNGLRNRKSLEVWLLV